VRSLAAKGVVTVIALAVVVALGVGAAPARAVVAELGGHGYGITLRHGVDPAALGQSSVGARGAPSSQGARRFDEPPFGGTELENLEEGPVMHSATTHIVYWDPGGQFTSTTKAIVDGFFTDVAGDSGLPTNVFAIAGQYTDKTGNAAYSSTFAGALVDEHAYPTAGDCTVPSEDDSGPYERCLFDRQLQEQLVSFIAERGLPRGPTQLYFVLLPHKVATCMEGLSQGKKVCSNNFFCAYHSFISPGTSSEIVYADIPFSLLDSSFAKGCQSDGDPELQLPNGDRGASNAETRFADVALKYISHEYSEAVTDPLVGFDTAWVDEEGLEVGDKCNSFPFGPEEEGEAGFDLHAFTPTLGGDAVLGTLFNQSIHGGSYYLQSEWDNAAKACRMRPLSLGEGSFVVPSATAGVPVTFTGSAFDPYPDFEPTWTFGDGATGSGRAANHAYARAGEFTVTMTPRDRLTNATGVPVSHAIVVGAAPVAAVPVVVAPLPPPPPADVAGATPRSTFAAATAVVDQKTGAVTLTTSVLDPGMFKFRATFANGRFGAFASAVCRKPRIRLADRCLPATIVYASGSKALAASGTVRVTLKPSASALKALRRALRQRRGLPLTLVLTFQSARGGTAFTRSQTLVVRPRR
jgi:PKD domain